LNNFYIFLDNYIIFILCCNYTRLLSFFFFILFLIICWYLVILFNKSILWYQIIFRFYYMSWVQLSYIIGIDGISLCFVVSCAFILMYCLLSYWFVKYKVNLFIFTLLLSLWLLLNVFTSLDLFFFYIYFEGVVIPMFFLIVFEVVEVVRFMLHINFLFIHY
jgi:NADH-quinone oxidoreductase subunit M